VVEPGAQRAVEVARTRRVGVIATEGTIRSRAYERAVLALDPRAQVIGKPCPLFVPLVEEGLCSGPIVDMICHHYLDELRPQIDTAILGCTHYPLLASAIRETFGPEIQIVDSAEATALALAALLAEHQLLAPADQVAAHRFLFTDAPERTAELSARFFQKPVQQVEAVDL
jgi:glutamate racemase